MAPRKRAPRDKVCRQRGDRRNGSAVVAEVASAPTLRDWRLSLEWAAMCSKVDPVRNVNHALWLAHLHAERQQPHPGLQADPCLPLLCDWIRKELHRPADLDGFRALRNAVRARQPGLTEEDADSLTLEDAANMLAAPTSQGVHAPTDDKPASADWSRPCRVREWAKIYGVSPRVMGEMLRGDKVRNKKIHRQSYRVALDEIPSSHRQRFLPTVPRL
jgi:hypothetical protein